MSYRDKLSIIFIATISAALVIAFMLFISFENSYGYKKGIYIRKQIGQEIIADGGSIELTFYSTRNEKYDFLYFQAALVNDDIKTVCDSKVTINDRNDIYQEIILELYPKNIIDDTIYTSLYLIDDDKTIVIDIGNIRAMYIKQEISKDVSLLCSIDVNEVECMIDVTNNTESKIQIDKILFAGKEYLINDGIEKECYKRFNYLLEGLNGNNDELLINPLIVYRINNNISYAYSNEDICSNELKEEKQFLKFLRTQEKVSLNYIKS